MTRPRNILVATVAAFALVAAACGGGATADGASGDGDQTATTTQPATGAGDGLTGTIAVSGSSTVEPVTAIVAEAFNRLNPEVGISVEGPGTGDGFKKFCAGETDISDASRPIKDAEKEACAANGVEFVELHIATDGLSILTSKANDLVTCLSKTDLYALTGPESIGFTQWSDASTLAGELAPLADDFGAPHAPYPDVPLVITGPGEESGTYDTYVELVLEKIADDRGQEAATRPDYVASANDNVIIEGIAGSDTSLGWVGYAFYLANEDTVKALEVDGGDGCVAPTPETIASFEYPLSRPLFIYVNLEKAETKPALAAFVDHYLSDEGLAAVEQAGYVSLDDYGDIRTRWAQRTAGSVFNP